VSDVDRHLLLLSTSGEAVRDVAERLNDWNQHSRSVEGTKRLTRRLIGASRLLISDALRDAEAGAERSAPEMDRLEELRLAETHVKRGEALVIRQREIIARLETHDLDLDVAKQLLEKLEVSLRALRDHLDLVRQEIEEAQFAWQNTRGQKN
jgi:hypothetical protein